MCFLSSSSPSHCLGKPQGAQGTWVKAAPWVTMKWADTKPRPGRPLPSLPEARAPVWGYVRVICFPNVVAKFSSKGYNSVETKLM